VKIAVLGPGGVGGLVAAALARDEESRRAGDGGFEGGGGGALADRRSRRSSIGGARVVVLARGSTARTIESGGVRVSSVTLGDFTAHPAAAERLDERVDALIVATKAAGLDAALGRVQAQPRLVLPLLNGLDHLVTLRERFGEEAVVAGTIRVEADRPEPGVVVHTSRFLRIDMASRYERMRAPMQALAQILTDAGVPARVCESEAQVMWSKLVRLNALACTTSAYDLPLGPIRSTPELRAELIVALAVGVAMTRANGTLEKLAAAPREEVLASLAPLLDALEA